MNTCPFCRGKTVDTHSPQDCLAHVKVRLREMTERRDALQDSLDNAKRQLGQKDAVIRKLRARNRETVAGWRTTLAARDVAWRKDLLEQRRAAEQANKALRVLRSAFERALGPSGGSSPAGGNIAR